MPTTITGQFILTHDSDGTKPYRGSLGGQEITCWADRLPKGPHGDALPPSGSVITASCTTTQKGRYKNTYIDSWNYSQGEAPAPIPAVTPSVTHPPQPQTQNVCGMPPTVVTTCFIQACEDVRASRIAEGAKFDPFADDDHDVLKRFDVLMTTYKAILAEHV